MWCECQVTGVREGHVCSQRWAQALAHPVWLWVSVHLRAFLTSRRLVPWCQQPAWPGRDGDNNAPTFGPGFSKHIAEYLGSSSYPWGPTIETRDCLRQRNEMPLHSLPLRGDVSQMTALPTPTQAGLFKTCTEPYPLCSGNPSAYFCSLYIFGMLI